MNNTDAIQKLVELLSEIEVERTEQIDYEILDIDRQLVIHLEFPTQLDQYNIILPRKFFREAKEKIGLELQSFEMISPDKDTTKNIEYLGNIFVPYPCIEIVFENPDVKEEEIEKFYVCD